MRLGLRVRWDSAFETPIGCVVKLSDVERDAAKGILARQLAPCGRPFAAQWLARVDAVMAGRAKGEVDTKARAAVMLMEMEGLPADLVASACRDWIRTAKWLPTPSELIALMEPELSKRRVMLAALENPEPERAKQIPVQRADPKHVSRLVAKLREQIG